MVVVVICAVVVMLMGGALLRLGLAGREAVKAQERGLQADWLAESGLERAWARLAADDDYAGETWEPSAGDLGGPWGGLVHIEVKKDEAHSGRRLVRVQADYPRDATLKARRTKRATLETGSGDEK